MDNISYNNSSEQANETMIHIITKRATHLTAFV